MPEEFETGVIFKSDSTYVVTPEGSTRMVRHTDGRINFVAPENVRDYLDSGLWNIVPE